MRGHDSGVKYYKEVDSEEIKARGLIVRDTMAPDFDKYVMPEVDLTEDHLSAHQVSHGMSSVRRAVEDELGADRYSGYDPLVAANMTQRPAVTIHHDRSIHMANADQDVLEINCAGSSFNQFRTEHLGFHGKDKSVTSRFISYFGTALKNGKRVANRVLRRNVQADGSQKTYDRITIPGPGQLNYFSIFSMNVIRDYVFKLSSEYIMGIVKTPQWRANHTPININISGHSRGGVGETLGIQKVMAWIRDTFGNDPATANLASLIKINMIQLDPVAGGDVSLNKYDKADLRPKDENEPRPQLDTTTVYSIHSDHTNGFTPMQVRGQSRIILMADRHGVGMDSIDTSQKDVEGDKMFHRPAVFDSKTGQAYRDTGYSEMPKGIFFRDENGAAVRMRSYGEAIRVMSKVNKGAKHQGRRHRVVERAIKEWFIDNDYVDETMSDRELMNMRKWVGERSDPNSPSSIIFDKDVKDSKEMEKLKSVLNNVEVNRLMTIANFPDDSSLVDVYQKGIEACKVYMESKNPRTDEGRRRLGAVSDYLSYYRAELHRLRKILNTQGGANAAG